MILVFKEELLVRATINLPGIPVGWYIVVNPQSAYIAECLAEGYLVPVEQEEPDEPDPS